MGKVMRGRFERPPGCRCLPGHTCLTCRGRQAEPKGETKQERLAREAKERAEKAKEDERNAWVDALELSIRGRNALINHGIYDEQAFLSLTRQETKKWRNFGARTWKEIEEVQRVLMRRNDPSPQAAPKTDVDLAVQFVQYWNNTLHPKLQDDVLLSVNPDGSLTLFEDITMGVRRG